jgi:hypothetical protein
MAQSFQLVNYIFFVTKGCLAADFKCSPVLSLSASISAFVGLLMSNGSITIKFAQGKGIDELKNLLV